MRIKSVNLTWFRGAAEPIALDLGDKSVVVYGENGAGKSSFVDAVEYIIHDGKIGHLSHEQSGKRQEKGIPNTHTPENKKASFKIQFSDASELSIQINRDGTAIKSGVSGAAIETWDYRRTILRQDEVARFIQNTKGEKYSALLPLLGLQHMEIAADNLRKLSKSIETKSKLKEIKATLEDITTKRKTFFGNDDNNLIAQKLSHLHKQYCPNNSSTTDPTLQCKELEVALDEMVARSSADQKQHLILKEISELNLAENIQAIRFASEKLTAAVEPLIEEKLQVLESTSIYVAKLDQEDKVNCPACGQEIAKENFQSHVADERARLKDIITTFQERKRSVGRLCDDIRRLKTSLTKSEVKHWRDGLAEKAFTNSLSNLDDINPDVLQDACSESDLNFVETSLFPLIEAAIATAKDAPFDVQKLSNDKKTVDISLSVFKSNSKAKFVSQLEALKAFVGSVEEETRKEIAEQSAAVIKAISSDIQKMWKIVHPGEHIEDVRLHVPEDTEKAIDICLKFHGVDQESPRLTLSEGFRNSLGLCIFLAMAKREEDTDRPIFLDDVVVSVDRNHRGMIVELFETQFSN